MGADAGLNCQNEMSHGSWAAETYPVWSGWAEFKAYPLTTGHWASHCGEGEEGGDEGEEDGDEGK